VNGASVPEPGVGGDDAGDSDATGSGWATAEWEAAVRRARVPDREDIEHAADAADTASPDTGSEGSEGLADADRDMPSPGDDTDRVHDGPTGPGDSDARSGAASPERVSGGSTGAGAADRSPDADPDAREAPVPEPSSDVPGPPGPVDVGREPSSTDSAPESAADDPAAGRGQGGDADVTPLERAPVSGVRPDAEGDARDRTAGDEAALEEPLVDATMPVPEDVGAETRASDVERLPGPSDARVTADPPDDVDTDGGSGPDRAGARDGGDHPPADDGNWWGQPGDGLRERDVRHWAEAAGERAGAEAQQGTARPDRDRAGLLRLYEVAAESVRTDTRLADVRVGLRWHERVPHDYFRPEPPPGLVAQGIDRAWARRNGDGVRLVVSPSVEMSQFTPGLNPVAEPFMVTVRDPDGRVVWTGPMGVDDSAARTPRLRTSTEQVAEVATKAFRDAAGVASGGVSELPGVGYAVDRVTERIGTDRSRVAEDRATAVPVPAERFTRDGWTLSVERPAHADAYARDGGIVRDLHVRTVREMARDGAVSAAEARALITGLRRLPWDWREASDAKPEDHSSVHRLLAEGGLRAWANDRLRGTRERQEGT
jgi:hypothetical protein